MHQSPSAGGPLLTAREVQDLLKVDRSTVYRMAEDGRLPAIRVGRSWRFPADGIRAMLAAPSGHAGDSRGDSGRLGGTDDPRVEPTPLTAGLAGVAAPPGRLRSGRDAHARTGSDDRNPAGADSLARTGAGSQAPTRAIGRAAMGQDDQATTGPGKGPRPGQLPAIEPAEISLPAARAVVEVAAELLGVMMVVTDMHGRPVTPVANKCVRFAASSGDPDTLAECIAEWRDLADHPDLAPRFQEGALGFQCARAFIRSGATLVGMVLAGGLSASPDAGTDPDLFHLDDAQRARVLASLPRIAAAISPTPPRAAADRTEGPAGVATKEHR